MRNFDIEYEIMRMNIISDGDGIGALNYNHTVNLKLYNSRFIHDKLH